MKTLVLMLYLFESGTYIRRYGEKYGFFFFFLFSFFMAEANLHIMQIVLFVLF